MTHEDEEACDDRKKKAEKTTQLCTELRGFMILAWPAATCMTHEEEEGRKGTDQCKKTSTAESAYIALQHCRGGMW